MTDTHTEALDQCPFCKRDGACPEEDGDDGYVFVLCTCTATGPLRKTEAEAIAAWNARAAIEALPARNDERALKLVEALETADYRFHLMIEDALERCRKKEAEVYSAWQNDIRAALADTQPSGETR